MAKVKLGCCSASIRLILIILNIVFLILGIVLFATAAALKWSTLFNKFLNIDGIDALVTAGSISAVSTVLLVIAGFAIVLSLFGICGAKYMNRCLLIVYEIIIVLLFLAHGISILVLVFDSSNIESKFKKSFNNTINDLNNNQTKPSELDDKCKLSYSISELFKCCGAQGPSDFINQTYVTVCCKDKHKEGCNDKVVKMIEQNAINFLVIPSAIILGVELFGILMVPILIRQVGNSNDKYAYDS